MGRESKLLNIAWELKNLWDHLTRHELSEYFGVSERTLFTYSKKLDLPKKIDKTVEETIEPVNVWVFNKETHKYTRTTFKNWQHFVVWQKAQPHPIQLDTLEKDGHKYVICKFFPNKTKEAEQYEKEICKNL